MSDTAATESKRGARAELRCPPSPRCIAAARAPLFGVPPACMGCAAHARSRADAGLKQLELQTRLNATRLLKWHHIPLSITIGHNFGILSSLATTSGPEFSWRILVTERVPVRMLPSQPSSHVHSA